MRGRQAYDLVVKTMSVVFVVIGLAILSLTLARGGGPLSTGTLLGLIFIAIGILRYRFQAGMGGKS